MARGLVLVDIQRDYFPGGAYPLVGSDQAADGAAAVLNRFRETGEPVIHIQHVWAGPDAPFFLPDSPGVEHDDRVAPAGDEPVVVKDKPNAFLGTDLESRLRAGRVDQLVVAGMMTSMCVDATVRAAADLGFTVTVVGDGCAAPDIAYSGVTVPGAQVHAAFLGALSFGYATVVDAGSLS